MFWRVWKDSVWSKVISVGIIFICSVAAVSYLSWWTGILNFLQQLLAISTTEYSLPIWRLAIIGALSFHSAVVLGLAVARYLSPPVTEKPPDWMSYKNDTFFDLDWRWSYSDAKTLRGLRPYCKKCSCESIPDTFINGGQMVTNYSCVSCGDEVSTL